MDTKWFLFCEDAHSNEVVSQALNGLQTIDEFKFHTCNDGVRRPLYEVPEYSFASRIWKSQKQLKAKVKIFRSQDGSKPTEWQFSTRQKPSLASLSKKSSKIKKAATALHQKKQTALF